MKTFQLDRSNAGVLVVDIQERLSKAMDPARLERVINRTRALISGARTLNLPIAFTEQYPKGLGFTVDALRPSLEGAARFEKISFSSALPDVLSSFGQRRQILVAGMETHICVWQTIRDLAAKGFQPVLLRDAAMSRTEEDRQAGIELARDVGALVTTVESALFDMLGQAGTPEFKAISAAVK